ncbi:DNA primase family protein [Xenorhabdus bovienii]|uniref:Putative P4-specific DNA primase n=1 Tax=Xenorhabdus bovienii str. kraussei Becker Underwood TaxID=1398204 RepID=A0A077PQ94_XENBV|nr:primase-like DNA-binding domain-containing protein [Xenorhabdus bovienii]CDH23208.1 putative P4-specific DNA primase [Xenorhabdus bovienii str. kraussei Becker Underwood]
MEVGFLFARGNARTPALLVESSFLAFSEYILSKRVEIAIVPDMNKAERRTEKARLYWFAPPTKKKGMPRKAENMASCAFGCADIDESTPNAAAALMPVLERYSMLIYHTASSTLANPRIRLMYEHSRLVKPDERRAIGIAVETMLMQEAGFTLESIKGEKARWVKDDDYLVFDRSVYGAQSYLYCPHAGAESNLYQGEVIDVDLLPLPVAEPQSEKPARNKTTPKSNEEDFTDFDLIDEYVIADLRSALWHPEMLKLACDNKGWSDNGYRLASLKETEQEDEARQLFIDWSVTAQDAYPEEDLHEVAASKWDNYLHASTTSYRSIFGEAQKLGWENPGALRLKAQGIGEMAASTRGELLAEHYRRIRLKSEDSEMVYHYTGQVWEYVPDTALNRQMAKMFTENSATYSPRAISSAIGAMKLQIPIMGEASRYLIGFANGVYDLEAQAFREHSPEDWITNHNGVEFTNPLPGENFKDHAPNFYKWLSQSACDNAQYMERIKAALFMVLANRYDWQLFLEITGLGGTGKSVFTGIATLLAGSHNAASGSVKDLDTARERDSFVGKSLITLPDQERYAGSGAGLKAITGGDSVKVDPKHIRPYETVIQAVIMATNNEPMHFTERQGGIARRRVIFPFNNQVKESEQDPQLLNKVKSELPVIVRCLLVDFTEQERAKRLLHEQRQSPEALRVKNTSDPLYGFCSYLKELIDAAGMYMGVNKPPFFPHTHLYHAYISYMEAHGHKNLLNLTRFGAQLPEILKEANVSLQKVKTRVGYQYNVVLTADAKEWIDGEEINNDNLSIVD